MQQKEKWTLALLLDPSLGGRRCDCASALQLSLRLTCADFDRVVVEIEPTANAGRSAQDIRRYGRSRRVAVLVQQHGDRLVAQAIESISDVVPHAVFRREFTAQHCDV